jgi:hypothetical protein
MITIIIVIAAIGFLVWMLSTAPLPIHPWFINLIVGIVVLCTIIWILNRLGVHTGIPIGF